jgi:predicted Zn-dependent protease
MFAVPVSTVASANISGVGSISSRANDNTDPREYVVNLTGVTNVQNITVTLNNVTDAAGNTSNSVSVPMAVLIGDTNADRFVDAVDVGQTKSQSGNAVTSANFREDVNDDGFIDAVDVALVKSKSGTSLPAGAAKGNGRQKPGRRAGP